LQLLLFFWRIIRVVPKQQPCLIEAAGDCGHARTPITKTIARHGIQSIAVILFVISAATQTKAQLSNEVCLGCHGNEAFAIPAADGQMRSLYVAKEKFEQSVHGKRLCVECHKNITSVPHAKTEVVVSCVQCHQEIWNAAQKDNKSHEFARLGEVVQQIDRYMKSIHARPNMQDQSRTNATCYNCHDAHYVYPAGSNIRMEWRLNIPNTCGKCHIRERELYATSVHGKEVLGNRNIAAAVCSDCHTTHDVEDPAKDATKLVITKNCGGCHSESFKSYTQTYHGQVHTLGYAYTAKCFDCHGSHTIQRVNDPRSSVHANHRLMTCQACHQNATAGFLTFQPHANTHDLARYPYTWLASKFMLGLLGGTFAFFWTHTALWFYREYKERKEGRDRVHVRTDELLPQPKETYYERWNVMWRIAHLAFAISLMVLVLTGMTAFYADSAWAPIVVKAFGGPKVTAAVHRVCAVVFLGVFFAHLVYVVIHVGRNWKTFRLFGPDSLIPNWQDLKDIVAMFLWFFGQRPRPVFDRWTYWEKFDYWAPFWGVTIIGASGLMLWMPSVTASILPGWVFNVATIAHGEEAVLAAGFLFTVHFFNNHFRPEKFPLDIQMFTGSMPLEVFRHEHTLEFRRLVDTGQLDKYLVNAPSPPMTLASKILGFTLIVVGLILLILVGVGFLSSLTRG
jgi:cytochrome b subunit of formate dehydrogenase